MLNTFIDPLCSKLCWHNRRVPSGCSVRTCNGGKRKSSILRLAADTTEYTTVGLAVEQGALKLAAEVIQ